jgi:Flp pilus assembly protein TadB
MQVSRGVGIVSGPGSIDVTVRDLKAESFDHASDLTSRDCVGMVCVVLAERRKNARVNVCRPLCHLVRGSHELLVLLLVLLLLLLLLVVLLLLLLVVLLLLLLVVVVLLLLLRRRHRRRRRRLLLRLRLQLRTGSSRRRGRSIQWRQHPRATAHDGRC